LGVIPPALHGIKSPDRFAKKFRRFRDPALLPTEICILEARMMQLFALVSEDPARARDALFLK